MICFECDSEVAHKPGCSMWQDDDGADDESSTWSVFSFGLEFHNPT